MSGNVWCSVWLPSIKSPDRGLCDRRWLCSVLMSFIILVCLRCARRPHPLTLTHTLSLCFPLPLRPFSLQAIVVLFPSADLTVSYLRQSATRDARDRGNTICRCQLAQTSRSDPVGRWKGRDNTTKVIQTKFDRAERLTSLCGTLEDLHTHARVNTHGILLRKGEKLENRVREAECVCDRSGR